MFQHDLRFSDFLIKKITIKDWKPDRVQNNDMTAYSDVWQVKHSWEIEALNPTATQQKVKEKLLTNKSCRTGVTWSNGRLSKLLLSLLPLCIL